MSHDIRPADLMAPQQAYPLRLCVFARRFSNTFNRERESRHKDDVLEVQKDDILLPEISRMSSFLSGERVCETNLKYQYFA
jgi:hypothetical protein